MFAVDEATAEVIRRTLNEHGELAAVVEFRRRFLGITDMARAAELVRRIARWQPLAPRPAPVGAVPAAPLSTTLLR